MGGNGCGSVENRVGGKRGWLRLWYSGTPK